MMCWLSAYFVWLCRPLPRLLIYDIIFLAEEDDVTIQLYEKPVPETEFVKHCAQRRKYPVLLKVNGIYSENNQ